MVKCEMVKGEWYMENRKYPILFFPFPIPHLSNIPSFTNRKTKKSVKCFINECNIIQNLLFYTLIHIVLTAFLPYSFPTGRVSLKKERFFFKMLVKPFQRNPVVNAK